MSTELLTKPLRVRKPPEERVTFEEFSRMVTEDQKADLIGGVIYMHSPASLSHEQVFAFLHTLLYSFVNRKKLGVVLGFRTSVRFSEFDAPEPDLLFVAKEREQILQETFVDGAPDMVAEIISPNSRALDLGPKRELYLNSGVREYWIIDPYRQTLQFLRNQGDRWEEIPTGPNNVLKSEVIPGFWLRIDWLFADPLPDVLEAVTTLLEIPEPTAG
jgi:Uma2 family endonuclease